MNIVREGSKHLILQSTDCSKMMEGLEVNFEVLHKIEKSDHMYQDYIQMLGLLDNSATVLLLSKNMMPKLSFAYGDFEYVAVITEDVEDLLVSMVTLKEVLGLIKIRQTPKVILMHTVGDQASYMRTVNYDVKGTVVAAKDIFEQYGSGTVIMFTHKRLLTPLSVHDLQPEAIFSERKSTELMYLLSKRRERYLNAGIEKRQWNEFIIKIYDSQEQYGLHYERLTLVLDELDCGLILGEDWGRDAALAFMSVSVYELRLFTYLDAQAIKRITLGLEYDSKGDRVVDLDLFVKKKKQYWTDARIEGIKERDALGMHYRAIVEQEMSEKARIELLTLERDIKK